MSNPAESKPVPNPVELVVPPLFNGPPTSANGGWISGALARHVVSDDNRTVMVTLRQPPPLDRPMTVAPVPESPAGPAGAVRLLDGEVLVAEAAPARLAALGTPPPVPFEVAAAAEAGFRGHKHHPFPTCFVCGTGRGDREGLHLFAGPVSADDHRPDTLHACTWTPSAALADPGSDPGSAGVRPEFVWAALDCPGAWTVDLETREVVLGRITARVDAVPTPGEACVITSRLISQDGRKFTTCTALYGGKGRLLGEAESVWIELRRA